MVWIRDSRTVKYLMVGDNFIMVGYDESNFINSEVIWGHYKFIWANLYREQGFGTVGYRTLSEQ